MVPVGILADPKSDMHRFLALYPIFTRNLFAPEDLKKNNPEYSRLLNFISLFYLIRTYDVSNVLKL